MKPIFFTENIDTIIAGKKTQTRRVIKPQPMFALKKKLNGNWYQWSDSPKADDIRDSEWGLRHDPRYHPGDILWVRETWCKYVPEHVIDNVYAYKADATPDSEEARQQYVKAGYPYKWRSPRYMPREAARLFLRVTDVRIERLHDISAADALAEGMAGKYIIGSSLCPEIEKYRELWDHLNAKRGYGWDINPWVWVYEFERCEKPT